MPSCCPKSQVQKTSVAGMIAKVLKMQNIIMSSSGAKLVGWFSNTIRRDFVKPSDVMDKAGCIVMNIHSLHFCSSSNTSLDSKI